jgi:transcriptional regulator with XRE-family HTH domain
MDSQLYLLRSKKIGVKIAMARQKNFLSIESLAYKLGLPSDELGQMERGFISPSLPQFHVMASLLDMPIDDLVNTNVLEPLQQEIEPSSLPRYYELRNRMLGIQIKKNRYQQNQSVEQLAQLCEIPTSDLQTYETGQTPIPLPLFLKISEVLHLPYERIQPVEIISPVETEVPLVAQSVEIPVQPEPEPAIATESDLVETPITQSDESPLPQEPEPVVIDDTIPVVPDENIQIPESILEDFPGISDELRDFITKPVNVPFLELAMKLSRMDAKKLRDIAESLLEITL